MFLRFLEHGLAYRAKSPVDWCPNDGTLAREQVEGAERRCWRCGALVEKRDLEQWYLQDDRVRRRAAVVRRHRLAGADPHPADELDRPVRGRRDRLHDRARPTHHAGGETIRVFTTRPDTLFGATFMVLAPEHPLVPVLTAPDRLAEVEAYVGEARRRTEIERLSTDREKTGVPIGADADQPGQRRAHPDLHRRLRPVRLRHRRDHGRPAHDERDFAFAERFGLPIRRVVAAPGTGADDADGRRLHRAQRRRAAGQQRPVRRPAGRRGRQGHRRAPGRARAPPSPRSPTACATG